MECIEARALKSSFLSESIAMKSTQRSSFDDFWCVAGINSTINNVSSDEFSVDDLLDLSDKDFCNSGGATFEESSDDSVSSQDNDTSSMNSSSFSSSADLVSLTADHLSIPIDDMESLEWLSQIVDDSVPELPILFPPIKLKDRAGRIVNRFEPVLNVSSSSFTVLGLPYPVPRKCRTAQLRKHGRLWSDGSLTESSSSSSTLHHSSTVYSTEVFEKQPAAKKQRKSPAYQNGLGSSESMGQRWCTHCQVQKTPQWRTGPLGPKTLCNACGVRFKSGRLYPEYRPACSPTFSGGIHSNSHRKVLELRKKERELEPALNMTVQ